LANSVYIPTTPDNKELLQREKDILRTIIHLYILNASPIGSRNLSKYLEYELKLSPATIRNIMSDLEDMEYISHPHTSAGRVPTDKGYRFYVNSLMKSESLSENELNTVIENLSFANNETILKDASKILGLLSRYLGIVEIPHLSDLIVHRIELLSLSSTRILVVVALDSNIVRTVTLEAEFEIERKHLESISMFINERITGKPLRYIRDNFEDILNDFASSESPLIRLFVDSIDKLFELQKTTDKIHLAGTQNLLKYPEFEDLERVKGVIELIENEDIIIHIMDQREISEAEATILIGREMHNELLEDYSLVFSNYQIGSASGSIGLIGPKRMNYSKMASLVHSVTEIISKK